MSVTQRHCDERRAFHVKKLGRLGCQCGTVGVWADDSQDTHDDLLAALKAAHRFIRNGIELGFLRMPDPETPDPAHDVLKTIAAAIAKETP